MSSEDLNGLLRRLHAELAAAPNLDAESRRLVDVVLADLGNLRPAPTSATARVAGGLEELAVGFEVQHPAVAAALRQVADLLGKAGI